MGTNVTISGRTAFWKRKSYLVLVDVGGYNPPMGQEMGYHIFRDRYRVAKMIKLIHIVIFLKLTNMMIAALKFLCNTYF